MTPAEAQNLREFFSVLDYKSEREFPGLAELGRVIRENFEFESKDQRVFVLLSEEEQLYG